MVLHAQIRIFESGRVAAALVAGLITLVAASASAAPFTVTYDFEDTNTPRQKGNVTGGGAANVTATDATLDTLANSGFSSTTDSIFVRSDDTADNETDAVSGDDYIEFTITAATGYQFDLDSLSYQIFAEDRDTAAGNGITINTFVRSNAELVDYTTTLTGSAISDSGVDNSLNGPPNYIADGATANVDLSSDTDFDDLTSVTFRLYVYDDKDVFNNFSRIDNIVFDGDVSLIPEPASLAMCLVGLALVAGRRRGRVC